MDSTQFTTGVVSPKQLPRARDQISQDSNSRRRSMSGYRCAQIQARHGHSRLNTAILNPARLVIDAIGASISGAVLIPLLGQTIGLLRTRKS